MKTFALTLCLLFCSLHLWAQRPFISRWITKTYMGNNYIRILTDSISNYNITWENMTIIGSGNGYASNVTGSYTISGLPYGEYKISITGVFPRIYTGSEDIWSIDQWGDIQWKSFVYAFENHPNLLLLASDVPDLSQVTSMRGMFKNCRLFTGNPSMANWNTENIQDMSFMFYGCEKFNQNISNWNTGNVTDMSHMFEEATVFNQPIGNWDVSKVTNMNHMFSEAAAFNQPLNNWNTGSLETTILMFIISDFNQPIGNWNVSKLKKINGMFGNKFNQPLGSWNTVSLEMMNSPFGSSFNQNLGSWNVEKVKWATGAFDYSGMTYDNYDSTLIGWSSQNLMDSVTLGALGIHYCNAVMERKSMIINHKWNFVGDIQSCLLTAPDEKLKSSVSLYPNPNPGSFVLEIPRPDQYQIFDIHGKLVSKGTLLEGKNEIQTQLSSGMYLIKLQDLGTNIKMTIE